MKLAVSGSTFEADFVNEPPPIAPVYFSTIEPCTGLDQTDNDTLLGNAL